MVKIYRLKYNLPTFWKGDICLLDENGDLWWTGNENPEIDKKERELHWRDEVCMYHKNTVQKFNILETYFEEIKDISKFWPFRKCRYYYISDDGVEWDIWDDNEIDHKRKSMGNCFLNKEWAEEAWNKILALCKLNQLGYRMDSYGVTKNGKANTTGKFYPEFSKEVNENLEVLLGKADD